MDKVILGFSGGVDSSVAARLLRERGFDVRGLFLDTGGAASVNEVVSAAKRMGLPLTVMDARAELEAKVCKPFFEGYLRGETPNPCILCNPAVKFKYLCRYADETGARYIATGHYVRSEGGAIYKGRPMNDQSYMLCRLTREQASRFVAPLGDFEKTEVRAMAEKMGLAAAKKPDSMEICFIPDDDLPAWMSRRGGVPGEGDLIYNGAVVGRHGGFHRYTLGQRRGLNFSAGKRVYVSEIRPETNEVLLSDGGGLFVTETRAKDMSWLVDAPDKPFRCELRVRHSKALSPALVNPHGSEITIAFQAPVRAPTPGQSAALYTGERLLGGGFIY